ncbi:ATP-grasp domain-containing protein [Cytobacillus kochii]|uniref:ATP-grasp domain-containing protein n=1 Tax=Cytobacillus kochii TaxID=859143 RepID=UPI00203F389F|nr:ATP-grasp domain-containing protein [Cytobacillus kochii]MCM3322421.1 ATP-grasp domain-containing protein [Cytobacillus kochii]MCM3345101.1 ATP-grasp domain-containing protein [Cytobacillus kochii]
MKKLLFIESNTTGTGMLALEKTVELGLRPVFITNNSSRYEQLTLIDCEVVIAETNDLEGLKHTILNHFALEEIAGITTTSEFYIYTVACLNRLFHFSGNSPDTIEIVRNKSTVRQVLRECSEVYQPYFRLVESEQDLELLKGELIYPVIVKPIDDSGSNFVRKCMDYPSLSAYAKEIMRITHNVRGQMKKQGALIEEYIEGQEYSVEVFSVKGKHHLIGVTEKQLKKGDFFIESGHVFPARIGENLKGIIEKGVLLILESLHWKSGPAHLEIKIKDNKVFLVEFNGRLAGGMIPELIKYATGVDLLKEQLKNASGIEPIIEKKKSLTAGIKFLVPSVSGEIKELHNVTSHSDIKEIRYSKVPGDYVKKAENAYGRIGYMVVASQTYSEMKCLLDGFEQSMRIEECVHDQLFK